MLGWLRTPVPPPISPANPGRGHEFEAVFDDAAPPRRELVNLLALLAGSLSRHRHAVRVRKSWLELGELRLAPQIVAFEPQASGVRTSTTIQVAHAKWSPPGFFEYQHAVGENLIAALRSGFQSWIELDLPVLLDALQPDARHCMRMNLRLPDAASADSSGPDLHRSVVLGPVAHFAEHGDVVVEGEHVFCPCCLLTQSIEAFAPILQDRSGMHAIRLFAARQGAGANVADCRINGEDYEPGQAALLRYVDTWPDRGIEYRKQLVLMPKA
jgi:hypothetical protein